MSIESTAATVRAVIPVEIMAAIGATAARARWSLAAPRSVDPPSHAARCVTAALADAQLGVLATTIATDFRPGTAARLVVLPYARQHHVRVERRRCDTVSRLADAIANPIWWGAARDGAYELVGGSNAMRSPLRLVLLLRTHGRDPAWLCWTAHPFRRGRLRRK